MQKICARRQILRLYRLRNQNAAVGIHGGRKNTARCKRDHYAWEQRKLGDLLEERNSQRSQSNSYPLVSFTVENGVTPKTDRYQREQLVRGDKAAKKYKVTYLDDIVYNPANLKFGAISRNAYGRAVFSPIYVTFRVKDKQTVPRFIEGYVKRDDFIKYSLRFQQGTVYERQSVSPDSFLGLPIPLPSIDEQRQIGAFFASLDDLIALHQRKPLW
ncbi:restriction endonuclease subunit S [Bifidobacterium tibiigranuli]|uniref:Restriction endonuclease subunit S n=1 Tax=Bifidobacterium tibiigranuli TaxID=2172043 RepID=A0A5N6S3J5_9BIFI|nr:restriction endonuclease subunit S [Bifidobacterium tibiigranuli]